MDWIRLPFLLVVVVILQGCSMASVKQLNESHVAASFENKIVAKKLWRVDAKSFEETHWLEIFPFLGHMGGSGRSGRDRMEGDFYDLFKRNSNGLMESIFGKYRDANQEAPLIVLYATPINSYSKSAKIGFADSLYEIEIEFTLVEKRLNNEKVLAKIVSKGRHESMTGNSFNYHVKAHERANIAINKAFVNAQGHLFNKLTKYLK